MSLYLCAFTRDRELFGVDVGAYDDFGLFRDAVTARLEGRTPGSRFPVLILHSDSDGEWTIAQLRQLREELLTILETPLAAEFLDVTGQPLVEQLLTLTERALVAGVPVIFQ